MLAIRLSSGDSVNEILYFVQNHQAESSFDFETPTFLKIFRVSFSTVRTEINSLLEISFFGNPQAISSAISVSRLESVAASFMTIPPRFV